jgi:hypothetical protein
MSKITYLLGAGASCNALPLVNNFKDRLYSFHKRLVESLQIDLQHRVEKEKEARELFPFGGAIWKDLQKSILWLRDIADQHASIDTYAKKLFIRNDNAALKDLRKLKAALSCYLLLEQSMVMVDKRYDNFFASILVSELGVPKLPKGVNIVTWNYDTQLEKSYEGFCTIPETVYEKLTQSKNIIRLNGTSALSHKLETRFYGHTDFSISFLKSIIELFDAFMKIEAIGYQPQISFAWERADIEDAVKQVLKGTTTLVIIGYSLPYFNRAMDKTMIHIMHPTLEKIYIQVPEKEYMSHKERFLTFYDDPLIKQTMETKINMVAGTDLFYIPDDMPR